MSKIHNVNNHGYIIPDYPDPADIPKAFSDFADSMPAAGGGASLPAYTKAGDVLSVNTALNGAEWKAPPSGLPPLTAPGEVLTVNAMNSGPEWKPAPVSGYSKAEVDAKVSALVTGLEHGAAVIAIQDNPPIAPVQYELYIIGTNPTGAWVGHQNEVAEWDGAKWVMRPATGGEAHLVEADNSIYHFNATTMVWNKISAAPIQQNMNVPVGTIVQSLLDEAAFNTQMGTLAGEWVLCDGRSIAGTDYATATGRGNVPDLRGAYMRMAGTNGANAAWVGGTLNGWQEDSTAMPKTAFTVAQGGAHHHSVSVNKADMNANWSGAGDLLVNPSRNNIAGVVSIPIATSDSATHTHTLSGGDTETRPKTYSVNYFIKVKKTPAPTPVEGPRGPAGSSINIWQGTQANYDAIATKDTATLYLIDKP